MKARRMACNTVRTSHLPCLPGSTEEEEEGADTWESVRTAELGARLPSIPPMRRRRRRRAHSGNSESHMCAEAGGGAGKSFRTKEMGFSPLRKTLSFCFNISHGFWNMTKKGGRGPDFCFLPLSPLFFPLPPPPLRIGTPVSTHPQGEARSFNDIPKMLQSAKLEKGGGEGEKGKRKK